MAAPFTTREFFAPFFPKGSGHRFIAMLRAYFDDSGTHTDGRSRMVVCGAVLISDDQHDLLVPAWESILSKRGLPFFHLTKFKAGKEAPYDMMTESDKEILLEQLLLVIRVRVKLLFASVVPVADYETALTSEDKKRYGNAYAWATQFCWTQIRLWADRHDYQYPIPFVVESGALGEEQLSAVFDKVHADPVLKRLYRLKSLTKAEKTDFPGVQVADIVANSMFELASHYYAGDRTPTKWAKKISHMLDSYVDVRQIKADAALLRSETDTLNEMHKETIALIEKGLISPKDL